MAVIFFVGDPVCSKELTGQMTVLRPAELKCFLLALGLTFSWGKHSLSHKAVSNHGALSVLVLAVNLWHTLHAPTLWPSPKQIEQRKCCSVFVILRPHLWHFLNINLEAILGDYLLVRQSNKAVKFKVWLSLCKGTIVFSYSFPWYQRIYVLWRNSFNGYSDQ